MRALLGLALACTSVTGCFKVDVATCAVACASSADCPGELACSPQGRCSVGGAACPNTTPDADLTMPQPLAVTVTGMGTVASVPSGISCPSGCSSTFPPLSQVMLTATPASGAVFDGWGGDCTGATSPCALTMDGSKTVDATFALHGARRWVQHVTHSGQDYLVSEIEVDAQGDVIVSGKVIDQGASVWHVAKYARATGAIAWEKKFALGNAGVDVGGLDTDTSGNVYVCGRLQSLLPVNIGGTNVDGDMYGNAVVLRLGASTGNVEWAKSWGGSTGMDECLGLAVVGTDLFVTGKTSSAPSNFDGFQLTGSTGDGFLVRAATSNGTAQDALHLDGTFNINDIAAGNGHVAITGSFSGNPTVGSCTLGSSGAGQDGFILDFTGSLVCAWRADYGSSTGGQNTIGRAIAPVPGGGWVTTGRFEGSVLFAETGSAIGNLGGRDAYLARFDANGTHLYSFGYGSADHDSGEGVDVTPTGQVVFAGEFASTITLGAQVLTGTNDLFVTRLSAGVTPIHEWAVRLGGTATDAMSGLHVDADGTVSILSYFTGMTDVGGTPLTAQDYDAWVGSFVR